MRSVRKISRKDSFGRDLNFFLSGFVEGGGIIKSRKKDNICSYNVTNPNEIIEKIIPFFQKYPVHSESKKRNFAIFCKIASLVKKGEHKNLSRLRKILELREQLNIGKGRNRKYGINDVFPKENPQRLHVNRNYM